MKDQAKLLAIGFLLFALIALLNESYFIMTVLGVVSLSLAILSCKSKKTNN